MNEKIEELARLAGFNPPHGDGYENKDSYTYFSYEQFAGLIIKECCVFADDYQIDRPIISKRIKKHFGIE